MAKRMLTCIFILFSAINAYSRKPKENGTIEVVFIAGTDSHAKGEHKHNGCSTLIALSLSSIL